MKLISFAAISLLAITVGAHLPQDATTQDLQSLQGATAQDPLPSCQDRIQETLDKLTELYWTKETSALKISSLDIMREKELGLRLEMERLKDALKEENMDDLKRFELGRQYDATATDWERFGNALKAKQKKLNRVAEERDTVKIKLITLKEHCEKLEKYNIENQDQIVLVPGFYSKKILVDQSKEVCQHSKELSSGNKHLGYGIREVGTAIDRLRISEEDGLIKLYNALSSYSQKLITRVEFSKKQCSYTKKLQKDPSW
ncbi:hypothetical protein BASA50_009101 [Batrachochytrium salamandrivorans]|uniref:Uncharacterized protein n=1 Tax=Batrachochytrium salamandrivorans TaxID=1357716 RepID=A0ABQ8F2U9_9FUNG|nr:hypothetical protein BASA60_010127 [Batrachochytrium salamandrivorans]KAH6573532.1 hypothetical protein BASA62_002939 [Batrachochytrium salamandrivorans]KAH6578536.1 hypothetical protein BASA61_000296 [Batrachochytrium salamandrivorans]KAH6591100.1 hypothetical protein BASA50_009101 [Batrachochytrium salamandrivorans]KAH9246781.1 hypothetical protein BASA81_015671 [Batrachochytrium salamandrivorans]